MSTIVTLDIFSGRANPSWELTPDQEREFLDRMRSLEHTTHHRPTGAAGALGYRGFLVSHSHLPQASSAEFRIHEGIIDRGSSSLNLIDTAELQAFLHTTMPMESLGIPPSASDYVLAEIGKDLAPITGPIIHPRPRCPACHAADAPTYNPAFWNSPAIQPYNNCYNYANDHATNTFAQPGRAHGIHLTTIDCPHVLHGAQADGLHTSPNFTAPLGHHAGWYVALVIWPGVDYHWYRQDKVGCWSHKPGSTAARNVDNAGHAISDPKTCNRGPYTVFCTYMVTKRGLVIS